MHVILAQLHFVKLDMKTYAKKQTSHTVPIIRVIHIANLQVVIAIRRSN